MARTFAACRSLVALSSAGAAVLALFVACTGEDPVLSSDLDASTTADAGTDGSPVADATSEDGATPPPLLTCILPVNPGAIPLPMLGSDAGANAIDIERFTIVRVNDNVSAAVAIDQSAHALVIATIDSNVSNPSPVRRGPVVVGGDRVLWVGRVSDGIGALVFGQVGGKSTWWVAKITDTDLLGNGVINATSSKGYGLNDATMTRVTSGTVLALGPDDYFAVGANINEAGNAVELVSMRLSAASAVGVETTSPAVAIPTSALVSSGGNVNAYVIQGVPPNFEGVEYVFNPVTAARVSAGAPTTRPDVILLGGANAGGLSHLTFYTGYAGGPSPGLRIGALSSLGGLDVTKLPFVPLTPTELSLSGAGEFRYATFATSDPLAVLASAQASGKGVGIVAVRPDGVVRIRQLSNGKDALLADVPNVARVSALPLRPPAATEASIALAWLTSTPTVGERAYYGVLQCR